MPAVLELKNIGKEFYQEGKKIKILEDINFTIEEHEFLAIVGPAGCGKSTLLKIIMGLDKPTKGEAIYHNNKIKSVDPNMSIIFQTFALLPWLDVLENVELGLEAQGMKKEVRMNKAMRMIQEVGLEGFENAHPRELSADMKQRVSIARALVTDPEVLLMDEPFSVMDQLTAEGLREELVNLWEDKYVKPEIILMVTHNI
jgi:NitT/TauT family transport system ATP-binding protein